MSDLTVTCPNCNAENQQVGKYCEQCGTFVNPPPGTDDAPTGSLPDSPADSDTDVRFVVVTSGILDPSRSFVVPRESRLLIGRTDLRSDPERRIIPDVDVTPWAQRVQTSEGNLFTIHRRQCYISRDADGVVRIVDYPDYVGDTLVSPADTADFTTIPALAQERPATPEGEVELRPGDRILMGQGEGSLIFQYVKG